VTSVLWRVSMNAEGLELNKAPMPPHLRP